MWENISQAALERIWTKYNLYGVVFLGRTYQVKDVHMKQNSQGEAMMVAVLDDCDQVMVSKKGAVVFCGLSDARSMYKAWISHCVNIEWDTPSLEFSVEFEGEEEQHHDTFRVLFHPKSLHVTCKNPPFSFIFLLRII